MVPLHFFFFKSSRYFQPGDSDAFHHYLFQNVKDVFLKCIVLSTFIPSPIYIIPTQPHLIISSDLFITTFFTFGL